MGAWYLVLHKNELEPSDDDPSRPPVAPGSEPDQIETIHSPCILALYCESITIIDLGKFHVRQNK